jgi:hypothetical protein
MMEIVKIFELYQNEIPDYIISIDTSGIEVEYPNMDGEKVRYRYTYDDVVEYYTQYEGGTGPKLRTFGPIIGHTPMIDALVLEIHNIFQHLDSEGYRGAYKNSPLMPGW